VPNNVLELWPEIFSVLMGIGVLVGAALVFSFRHRSRVEPGSSGHRPEEEQTESEIISPDGYIDSFAGKIEEAGGALPLMGRIVVVIVLIAYVVYLILFWAPR
jgi:hypothetical protein